jgi:YbbR domain-containing protein
MPARSLFLDHLWLKGFSLILATLIWLTIHANVEREAREETKTFDHEPVALLADSSEHRAFVLDPAEVRVTVKGPKAVIDSLRDIRAYVELASHAGNTGNYTVEVHAPAGITVALVTPRTVFVRQAAEGK